MPAKRALKIPPPNTSPRDSLPPSDHATVDTVLKELKQSTRRLQDALELHHVELQVLEKLYYKGNNQHRTALFWRRVLDIRRFARRLEGADLYGLMDGVRVSFWGDETQRNPRILKGSWTCYPDAKTVQTVLRRLIDCHTLVQHMHEHVSKAHNHFNLEFQGGAFLQLILTLTAISSRIGMLLTEVIQPAIEQAGQVLYKLLFFVLHLTLDRNAPSWVVSIPTSLPVFPPSEKVTPSARVSESVETPAQMIDFDEDIGTCMPSAIASSMTTKEPTVTSTSCEKTLIGTKTRPTEITFAKSKTRVTQSTIGMKLETSGFSCKAILKQVLERTSIQKEAERVSSSSITQQKDPIKRNPGHTKKAPKTKKKKDEIDDIFGF